MTHDGWTGCSTVPDRRDEGASFLAAGGSSCIFNYRKREGRDGTERECDISGMLEIHNAWLIVVVVIILILFIIKTRGQGHDDGAEEVKEPSNYTTRGKPRQKVSPLSRKRRGKIT